MPEHPHLHHVATFHIDLAPAVPGGDTPRGQVDWFGATGGDITSASPSTHPQLHLKVLPGGGDYTTSFTEYGAISLDINILAQRNVGDTQELFRFQARGFVHVNDKIAKIFAGDPSATSTEFGEAYIFQTFSCNTSSKDFGWMNFAVLVGQGRIVVDQGKVVAAEFRAYELVN
jgi:hypothetical protein